MQGFTQPEREYYGKALLSIIRTAGQRSMRLVSATTFMTGGKRELMERMACIGKGEKNLRVVTIAVLLCAATFALAACGERTEQKNQSYAQYLFDARAPFIGDNAAVRRLLDTLAFPQAMEEAKLTFELFTAVEPYGMKAIFTMGDAAIAALLRDSGIVPPAEPVFDRTDPSAAATEFLTDLTAENTNWGLERRDRRRI